MGMLEAITILFRCDGEGIGRKLRGIFREQFPVRVIEACGHDMPLRLGAARTSVASSWFSKASAAVLLSAMISPSMLTFRTMVCRKLSNS
jgi:hypothetical protein